METLDAVIDQAPEIVLLDPVERDMLPAAQVPVPLTAMVTGQPAANDDEVNPAPLATVRVWPPDWDMPMPPVVRVPPETVR